MQLPTILITIPISLLLIYQTIRSIQSMKQFQKHNITRNRSYTLSWPLFLIKHILLILCIICITIAVFRPQWGIRTTSSESRGIDIIFTLDVSESMNATDREIQGNQTNRLTLAKNMIQTYVQENPQNRYGLVIFAGEAFVSTPLTLDEHAFLTFLEGIDTNDVAHQGTNLAEALKASIERFHAQDADKRGKAIILMSDGGEEENGNYQNFTHIAKQEGIIVYTIGIGGTKPVPIPEGVDLFGHQSFKTYQGETVLTKLNEKPLQTIANMTQGTYHRADSTQDINHITKDLKHLKTSVLSQEKGTMVEDQYQMFILVAFICLIGYLLLPLKKIRIR